MATTATLENVNKFSKIGLKKETDISRDNRAD